LSSTESEKEEEEISDEPNHDPCEDHARKFVRRGDVCVSVDCVCSSPSSTQASFSFSPPVPSSSPSPPTSSSASASSTMVHISPSKASTASVSSPSFLLKFSNVFSCCMVSPPEKDVDILRRLSQKLLNPPLVIDNNNKIVSSMYLLILS
jgi:hypothetical protein